MERRGLRQITFSIALLAIVTACAKGGGGGSGGSESSTSSVCSTGQTVSAVYPSHGWSSDANTIALYKLGSTADAGPNGYTLTNTGSVSFTNSGLDWSLYDTANSVAAFSGGNQYLQRTGLTVGNNFTLEMKVFWRAFRNRTCGGNNTRIFSILRNAGAHGVTFEHACSGSANAKIRVNNTTDMVTSANMIDLMENQWHTVRLVFNGGTASFYVDGTQYGSTAAVNGLGNNDWILTLGEYFDGMIDEVRLSDTVRSNGTAAPTVKARTAYKELTTSNSSASFTATVSGGGSPSVVWSVVSQPSGGSVVFSDPNAATTTATFCAAGKYILQATAYNSDYALNDYAVVRVWPSTGRSEPYKTIQIGNSFTFYNGTVPYRQWQLSKAAGEAVGSAYSGNSYYKVLTTPGVYWHQHWYDQNANGEGLGGHTTPAPSTAWLSNYIGSWATEVTRSGGFDVVFIHSRSTAPMDDLTAFYRFGRKWDRLIKQSGARTVLFQTWAYAATIGNENTILTAYETLQAELGSAITKAGRAFKEARDSYNGSWTQGDGGVYHTDDYHPNVYGTYLEAALNYATMYGASPASISCSGDNDTLCYPPAGDSNNTNDSQPISANKSKADQMRTIAAGYVPAAPLDNGN